MMMMMNDEQKIIKIADVIGPAYYETFHVLEKKEKHICWLKGGRGSLKGSFVYLYTIFDLSRDALNGIDSHCVALRKVKDTIRDSIFNNLIWAIDVLNLNDMWDYTTNPMKIWNLENGNTILFRGCNNQRDFEKIKSLKFKTGFCKIAIFEELTEFYGMDEINSIQQSLFRGVDESLCFMMYNPPPQKTHWVNDQCKELIKLENEGIDTDTHILHTTYLQAPKKWLGKAFIRMAKQIEIINHKKYRHMYLGEEIGQGLEIYPEKDLNTNDGVLIIRPITDKEIENFDVIYRGIDFGYSHATCYLEIYYDDKNDIVYIFNEVYLYKASNSLLYRKIKPFAKDLLIRGDSEDPRLINEFNQMGLYIIPATKGKDSKPHGIKFLQDRTAIIIDKQRCPNTANDFLCYEYKKDKKTDNIIYEYPEEPDGSAACRYALEPIIKQNKWKFF
jgi:phage terminase large subunit